MTMGFKFVIPLFVLFVFRQLLISDSYFLVYPNYQKSTKAQIINLLDLGLVTLLLGENCIIVPNSDVTQLF